MLHELKNVRQIEGEGFRRWFRGDDMELIVWYHDEAEPLAEPIGFQLCYDLSGRERALTWRRDEGYSHTQVDTGERPFVAKMTPVLVPDGKLNGEDLRLAFLREAGPLDSRLVDLVAEKILSCAGSQ